MTWRLVRGVVATLCAMVLGLGATAYTVYPGDSIQIRYSNGEQFSCTLNSVAYRGTRCTG